MKNRWGLERTPQGGVSIGWTSIETFRKCMRLGYWTRLHGGTGLEFPEGAPNVHMLYGALWHKAYRCSYKGQGIREGLAEELAERELEAEAYSMLCDEVQRDIDWYWKQDRGEGFVEVLACEDELRLEWGKHVLRGTPDLVAKVPSGSIVLPDHKTFGVIRRGQGGKTALYLEPSQDAIAKYQVTRQFPFYCAIWNKLHPEALCYDAMLNMVPSHVGEVLDIINSRAGSNHAQPKIKRIPLEPYSPQYLDELFAQSVRLCDYIADNWDTLEAWAENPSACVSRWGQCAFYGLCTDTDMRETLINEVFRSKE